MIPLRDLNPTRTFPVFTVLLVGINLAVFLFQVNLMLTSEAAIDNFYREFGATPCLITGTCPQSFLRELGALHISVVPLETLFTSMFVHGGWLHIAGNMLFLWIFGNNVEDFLGHLRFLLFYFLCGLLATFAQIAFEPTSTIPSIGASGAIAGVLGAYFVRFPTAPVYTLVFVVVFGFFLRLPTWVVLGEWIVVQFLQGQAALGSHATSGVATFAHIGGFVVGMVLIFLFARNKPPPAPYAYTR